MPWGEIQFRSLNVVTSTTSVSPSHRRPNRPSTRAAACRCACARARWESAGSRGTSPEGAPRVSASARAERYWSAAGRRRSECTAATDRPCRRASSPWLQPQGVQAGEGGARHDRGRRTTSRRPHAAFLERRLTAQPPDATQIRLAVRGARDWTFRLPLPPPARTRAPTRTTRARMMARMSSLMRVGRALGPDDERSTVLQDDLAGGAHRRRRVSGPRALDGDLVADLDRVSLVAGADQRGRRIAFEAPARDLAGLVGHVHKEPGVRILESDFGDHAGDRHRLVLIERRRKRMVGLDGNRHQARRLRWPERREAQRGS